VEASEPCLSTAEFADLAGITRQAAHKVIKLAVIKGKPWRDARLVVRSVAGQGGRAGRKYEVRLFSLPQDLQTKHSLAQAAELRHNAAPQASALELTDPQLAERQRVALWEEFARRPQSFKDEAARRLEAVQSIHILIEQGVGKVSACAVVASQIGESTSTVRRWCAKVKGIHRSDWLAVLLPDLRGRPPEAECAPEAWELFKGDYLRLEQPTASACYERIKRTAEERDWIVPSLHTLRRRMQREIPEPVQVLAREGPKALTRRYPAQRRDHSVFAALEAVNSDGHRLDLFCRWGDGEVARPILVAVQDIYSGKLLAWRVDRTENAAAVRLAFADVVERYGIPEHAYLDNGRAFASKWLTGGIPNRYRFKVKADEPSGVLTRLGVQVHWATPYHGQSKPVERAFGDLAEHVSRHPRFAGAYTGNTPTAKPENYGSRAVPISVFMEVLEQQIAAHNARPGRRSPVCHGRSFDEVFAESYGNAPIRKATAWQRRQLLLAAEVTTSRQDGTFSLGVDRANRYWLEELSEHCGERLTVHFDPDRLHESVFVSTLDGVEIGEALCIEPAGFDDAGKAREHQRARNHWKRAVKEQLAAERRMDALQVADQLPAVASAIVPEARIVRPYRASEALTEAEPAVPADTFTPEQRADIERRHQKMIAEQEAARQPHAPTAAELTAGDVRDVYRRWQAIDRRIAAGEEVYPSERDFHRGYPQTSDYKVAYRIYEVEFKDFFGLAEAG
jgi:putative transposase